MERLPADDDSAVREHVDLDRDGQGLAVIRRGLCALVVIAAVGAAHADPLPLAEVVQHLDRHPLMTAAGAGIDRARGEALAAEGAFDVRFRARGDHLPYAYYERTMLDTEVRKRFGVQGLELFAGYKLGTGRFPDYELKYATLDQGELRAGFELPLLRDGAIDRARADLRKAAVAGSIAVADRDRRTLDLARDATSAYWDWVAAGQRLAVRTRQVALARDRESWLQRQIAAGDVPPIDAVDNARTVAAREAQVITARRDVERAALVLSLFHRDAAGEPVISSVDRLPELGPLPAPLATEVDDRQTLAGMRARQPLLAAFDARLAANAVDRELADNQLLPALTASAYASRGIGDPDPRIPDRSSVAAGIGVTLEIPLERSQARGARAIARADRTRLLGEQRFAIEQLEVEARAAAIELRAARRSVDLAVEQERLATELANAERSRFARGDTTLLVVNLREEAAVEAAIARIDAITTYRKARARYQWALGLPVGGWQ